MLNLGILKYRGLPPEERYIKVKQAYTNLTNSRHDITHNGEDYKEGFETIKT